MSVLENNIMTKTWCKGQQKVPETPEGYRRITGDIENKSEVLRVKKEMEGRGEKVAVVLYDDNGLVDVIMTKCDYAAP
jgi:hypothetical protein